MSVATLGHVRRWEFPPHSATEQVGQWPLVLRNERHIFFLRFSFSCFFGQSSFSALLPPPNEPSPSQCSLHKKIVRQITYYEKNYLFVFISIVGFSCKEHFIAGEWIAWMCEGQPQLMKSTEFLYFHHLQEGRDIQYVKIHATWEVLTRYAEIMKIRMPMQEVSDPRRASTSESLLSLMSHKNTLA